MSDAALMHAERMARGEESYQGKLLEARENDYKDEIVLIIISAPIVVLAWGVFSSLPIWFQTLWITVVASIFGIKGTQIFRNGSKKK